MIELFGIYNQRNKMHGAIDYNSGGNTFFIGPSLWFSTKQLVVQIGIAFPVAQHNHGMQAKDTYFIAANIGFKFNT